MSLLTLGQMAKLNGVGEKALRLYQEKGFLIPEKIDSKTGYRYYAHEQSVVIDMIKQLQSIGFSLDEIQSLQETNNVANLKDEVLKHLERKQQELNELTLSIQIAQEYVRGCDALLSKPICNQIQLEWLPDRVVMLFDVPNDPEADPSSLLVQWEFIRMEVKRFLMENNYPSFLSRKLGSTIPKENLEDRSLTFDKAYIFMEGTHKPSEKLSIFPGGQYLTFYSDHFISREPELYLNELDVIYRMLDYAGKKGFEVNGRYYDEVIAETPMFLYDGRDSFYKACLPVRRP